MVALNYLSLVALLLIISNANALNEDLESELRSKGTQTQTKVQVFQRANRKRGLKKAGKGKGKGTSRPTPSPSPMPTPGPSSEPSHTPSDKPSSSPSTKPSSSPSARPSESPSITASTRPSESPSFSPSDSPSSAPTIPDVFESYIRLEVATTGGVQVGLGVVDALATLAVETYNDEGEKCADPFARRMTSATFFSQRPVTAADERRMRRNTKVIKGDHHSERKLQELYIFIFLRVSGRCNACKRKPFFFNQVVGRRLQDDTCITPPVEDFLKIFNDGLTKGDFGNVLTAQSVKDVNEPKETKKGKGKGKGAW